MNQKIDQFGNFSTRALYRPSYESISKSWWWKPDDAQMPRVRKIFERRGTTHRLKYRPPIIFCASDVRLERRTTHLQHNTLVIQPSISTIPFVMYGSYCSWKLNHEGEGESRDARLSTWKPMETTMPTNEDTGLRKPVWAYTWTLRKASVLRSQRWEPERQEAFSTPIAGCRLASVVRG